MSGLHSRTGWEFHKWDPEAAKVLSLYYWNDDKNDKNHISHCTILYYIKLTHILLPMLRSNWVQTWKWDDETHLLICLKRGSTILRNSAGSMTSSSSSISPKNITCHHRHRHFNMEHHKTKSHRRDVPRSWQTNGSSDCFWTVPQTSYGAGARTGDCSIIAVIRQARSVLGWVPQLLSETRRRCCVSVGVWRHYCSSHHSTVNCQPCTLTAFQPLTV